MSRTFLITVIFSSILMFLGISFLSPYLVVNLEGSREVDFIIEKGESAAEIGADLIKEGLINNKLTFDMHVFFKKLDYKFQPGEYKLYTGMGMGEVLKILTTGIYPEAKITIIEGWNIKDITKYLVKKNLVDSKDFLNEIQNVDVEWLVKYDFLKDKPERASLEGYLFPDTYKIFIGTNSEAIVNKMLSNFEKRINKEMLDEIKSQGKTLYEILTMASIIEKEVPKDEDRKIVADIFYKRLKIGKALESCATINYILGDSKKKLSFEDTRVESSYNTYIHPGLPPGPICNPSLSAIRAAIYPQKNDYWYFLSADDGTTIFSKTIEKHIKNKAKYLK